MGRKLLTGFQADQYGPKRIRHYQLENHDGYLRDDSFWLVWDKTGTRYKFGPGPYYPDFKTCGVEMLRRWQWPLVRVRNIFGQELRYEYEYEKKVSVGHCKGYQSYHSTAVYPVAIYYPHDRYRVIFNRIPRTDYDGKWETYKSFRVLFKRSLLSDIRIEHDADGDGTFEGLIRKYVFTYASDPEDLVFPNVEWNKGGKTPTLIQVQEFGLGGSEALPPCIFEYGATGFS